MATLYIHDSGRIIPAKIKVKGINDVFERVKQSKFVDSTIKADHGQRVHDFEMRVSQISLEPIAFPTIEVLQVDGTLVIDDQFEFLKYSVGGHFDKHSDRKRHSSHTHTLVIYPPQDCEGGALELHLPNRLPISIKPSSFEWIFVMFPIETQHLSTPVTKGTKYLFKGTATFMAEVSDHDDDFIFRSKGRRGSDSSGCD